MHRRLVKSLATMMGAAALLVAPIALVAPAANADHVLTPTEFTPQSPDDNKTATWVAFLEAKGYTDVECVKYPEEDGGQLDDPFEIPEPPAGTEYVLAVVKGGAGEKANELYWNPGAGHLLSHATAGNSHIILCTGETPDTKPPTTEPPTTKPPVVETDRVADTGSTTALGVFAAGAMIAGAGALFLSRRRQGAHR